MSVMDPISGLISNLLLDKDRFSKGLMITQIVLFYYLFIQFLAFLLKLILPDNDLFVLAIILAVICVIFFGLLIVRSSVNKRAGEVSKAIQKELIEGIRKIFSENLLDPLKTSDYLLKLILRAKISEYVLRYIAKSFFLYLIPFTIIYFSSYSALAALGLMRFVEFMVFPSLNLFFAALAGYVIVSTAIAILKMPAELSHTKYFVLLIAGCIIPVAFFALLENKIREMSKIEKREFYLSPENFKEFIDFLFIREYKLISMFTLEEVKKDEENKKVIYENALNCKPIGESQILDSIEVIKNMYLILKNGSFSVVVFTCSPLQDLRMKSISYNSKLKYTVKLKPKTIPLIKISGFEMGNNVLLEFTYHMKSNLDSKERKDH